MVPCEAGDVLYLALEDTGRRLQDRLVRMLNDPRLAPARLHRVTEWSRFDAGGLEALEEWLTAYPDARLVIIDTLGKVRARRQRNANLYDEDYAAGTAMKKLADRYGVAILVNHHTSQARAEDVFDTVSGTLATTGAADAVIVIQRSRGVADATLDITGRDVEEARYALRWNASVASWTILDLPSPDISVERLAVLSYVREHPGATPSVTVTGLGNASGNAPGNAGAMRKLMWTMARDGLLTGDATHGYYSPVTGNAVTGVTTVTGVTPDAY